MLYHIPSFPSPLFLTFFESLPRRVFFSDLWNPGGVWWYFKSKFWPLHTRTEMSDLSDKLTLKFHNLNCKKIFSRKIKSPFWCPTRIPKTNSRHHNSQQMTRPNYLWVRFHIKSQASLLLGPVSFTTKASSKIAGNDLFFGHKKPWWCIRFCGLSFY